MCLALLVRGWMPQWVFQVRQASIAESYCVSRGISGNSCQGSCFLKQALEDQERESGRSPLLQLAENELVFIEVADAELPMSAPTQYNPPSHTNDLIVQQLATGPDSPPPWRRNRLG